MSNDKTHAPDVADLAADAGGWNMDVLDLPGDPMEADRVNGEMMGFGDFEGPTAEQEAWPEAVERAEAAPKRPRRADRRVIRVSADTFDVTVCETLEALAAGDPGLYQRGDELVTLISVGGTGLLRSCAVPDATMKERVARVAKFKGYGSGAFADKIITKAPPADVCKALHARGDWPGIRVLAGLVTAPVLRPDGTVAEADGYDRDTGFYFDRRADFPLVPDAPTLDDARAALNVLVAPFEDFPFADDSHRAAFLATILTCIGRSAIDGPCPGVVLEANVRGTGKSLLAACIGQITMGRAPPAASFPDNEDERRKTILAEVREARPILLFDDVAGAIGGAELNKLLTATEVSGRVLGVSRVLTLPAMAVVVFTANNAAVTGDTVRRVLPVRLESRHERPEDRTGFVISDLRKHVASERPALVVAALTVLRAWFVAGQPDMDLPPWGSFEAWSRVIRNAMVWAGSPDPADSRTGLRADEDAELVSIVALHDEIETLCVQKGGPVTAKQIADAAADGGTMADALAALPGRTVTNWDAKVVGYRLKKMKDRVVDDRRLVQASRGKAGVAWAVKGVALPVPAEGGNPGPADFAAER